MKLLHKQLSVVCLPFLVLAFSAWIVGAWFIEPFERKRLRAEAQRELKIQAEFIRQKLQHATSQLRLLAELPAFRSGDMAAVQAELQRLNAQPVEPFASLHGHRPQALNAGGPKLTFVTPDDERRLSEGESLVTDFRAAFNTPALIYVMVPIRNDAGQPVIALAGELRLSSFFPMLDPNLVEYRGEYVLVDAQGKEVTAAHLKSSAPFNQRNPWQADRESHGERVSVPVVPWNWKVEKFITWRMATGALRFQRELLIILSLLCLALAAGATVWLHRATARRLAKLTEQIQIFGASDQTIRSTELSADELGRVAEAFNCMADDVSHAQRKLQKQLAEHQHSPGLWKEQIAELEGRVAELERYAAQVAHEFHGPLATLAGFTTSLSASAKAQAWDRFDADVARMQTISRQLRDVVDVLLKLAKRETNQPFAEAVSLQRAAAEAKALLPMSAALENLAIAANLPTVPGDPVLWRHLFLNLLQNALKACAETKSPRIEIGWERRSADVVCYVRDHGRGISPAELERIFQGPDFGLRLVRQIVELHGGKVWAESNGPGTGMTVWWTVIGP